MKILFGTGNLAKFHVMKRRLEKFDIELISLNDLKEEGAVIPRVLENGGTPLENARQKATAYYETFHIPVFSCDSGLYFDNVPDEVQPGVHVRNVNGKYLSDEEMIAYYTGLVKQYGKLTASYKNAICFVMDEEHIYELMDSSIESEKFIITDIPHSEVMEAGFPLDSISIDIKSGKYYYDLPAEECDKYEAEDGFLKFFQKVINSNGDKFDARSGHCYNSDFGDIEECASDAEIWDLYNENRELLGKDHIRGKKLPIDSYHLVVHVWIRNSKGEYLISQRSANRPTFPSMWETVGGSVVKGEDSLQGAIREAKEEVGVDLVPENGKVLFTKIRKDSILDVWLFEYDGEVDLCNATTDEVAQAAWMDRKQIKGLFDEKKLVDTLKYFFLKVDK